MNKEAKKPQVDYRNFIVLTLRQKLPSFLTGVAVTFLAMMFIVSRKTFPKISFQVKNGQSAIPVKKDIRKRHIVETGDDLWNIAQKYFGSGYNAFDIAATNNLKEPYVLTKGQALIIPSIQPKKPTQGDITEIAASTSISSTQKTLTYTVKEGEYLFEIAKNIYGDGNLMGKIIETNKIPPPYDVSAGQILLIPR